MEVKDKPLNAEQIAEYIHVEHTPYSSMSLEDGKKHLSDLIERYAQAKVNEYKESIELL